MSNKGNGNAGKNEMKTQVGRSLLTVLLCLILAGSLAGCSRSGSGESASTASSTETVSEVSSTEPAAEPEEQVLTAALYPYVPDPARFEKAVRAKWETAHPEMPLHFVQWDSYDSLPPDDVDVFVFDGIFLSEMLENGCLLPVPEEKIGDIEDIRAFALEGCREDGVLYAVPQILCTNLLYTRAEDAELAEVCDIETLYEKMGDRESDSEIPGENEGLLIDMTGGTTKVTMYLDALCDVNQAYTDYDEFPDTASFSEESLELLRLLRKMGGLSQVNYWPENDDSYIRGRWFSEGKGRALIGYTEIMSVMGEEAENIIFRTFSYNKEENIPLFFGDLAGINSKINEEKKEAAYDLLEILTCAETIESAILPGRSDEAPQYLLPARMSVYEELGKTLPVYEKLGAIAANPENRLFKMGADVREYLAAVKKVLAGLIFE